MKRVMVLLGLGSLMLMTASVTRADFPVSYQGAPAPVMGQPISWHTDLESGWRESKRLNLPMVIFITMEPCVYCDAMKRDTWCNTTVQNRMSGNFVAIRLNKVDNAKTLSRIKVSTYPTTLLGTPKGKVVGHRLGYQPPVELKAFLAEAQTLIAKSKMSIENIH